jgi:hypothetical protein
LDNSRENQARHSWYNLWSNFEYSVSKTFQGENGLKPHDLVSASFCVAAILAGASAQPADAAIIVNISQVNSDVVATFSGSLNLAALTFNGQFGIVGGIAPTLAIFANGNGGPLSVDGYSGLTGPTSWGGGGGLVSTSNTGALFDISGAAPGTFVEVPHLYASGSALSGSSTFANQTLSSIGLIAGTYTYTWGSGLTADSVVVNVGTPEPGSWLLVTLGLASLLFAQFRNRIRRRST